MTTYVILKAEESLNIAKGRGQLAKDLMARIGSLDMRDSANALDTLLGGIQKIQKEARAELIAAEENYEWHTT